MKFMHTALVNSFSDIKIEVETDQIEQTTTVRLVQHDPVGEAYNIVEFPHWALASIVSQIEKLTKLSGG